MKQLDSTKALTFSSIMAGLTIILILISTYLSGTSLIAILLIPMCSSFVSIKTKLKYRLIYFFACLITFFIDPSLTLFIVIPSLISGIVFGQLISKYLQGYYIIFINTIIVSLLQILSTYLVYLIFEVNMIEVFSLVLKIDIIDFDSLYYFFVFTLSLIQVSLTYLIITNELKKLNYEFNEKKNQFLQIFIVNISLILICIISYFFSLKFYCLFLGYSIYFGVVLAYYIFSFYQSKKIQLIQIPLYFISLLGISILYSKLGENSLILLLLPLISQIIGGAYIIISQKIIKKGQINESLFDKL